MGMSGDRSDASTFGLIHSMVGRPGASTSPENSVWIERPEAGFGPTRADVTRCQCNRTCTVIKQSKVLLDYRIRSSTG